MKYLFLILLHLSLFSSEATYEKGKDLYFSKGCANCHGTQAEGSSYYPKLAKRPQAYIINKLTAFQKGIASSQKQEIMFSFAEGLHKEEIQSLALYLSTFTDDNKEKYRVSDDILGSVD